MNHTALLSLIADLYHQIVLLQQQLQAAQERVVELEKQQNPPQPEG